MEIKKIVVGDLEENCYILIEGDDCIIIDPGDDFHLIKQTVDKLNVVGCLITHFHQDHIGALEEVLSTYDVEINKVNSDKFKYTIIDTPGHTGESKSYYFKDDNVIFTGDFIFKGAIGRTDLGGNDLDMKDSLDMISKYDDNIILYPGHGPSTTLGEEKKYFKYYQ